MRTVFVKFSQIIPVDKDHMMALDISGKIWEYTFDTGDWVQISCPSFEMNDDRPPMTSHRERPRGYDYSR